MAIRNHDFWSIVAGLIVIGLSNAGWAQPRLEFEFGGGPALGQTVAPAFSARVGVFLMEHFTISVRGLAVVGPEGKFIGDGVSANEASGYEAASVFGELRLHSVRYSQRVQIFFGLGIGGGKLISSNMACNECNPTKGSFSLYLQASLGLRVYFHDKGWAALELGPNQWNGVHRSPSRYTTPLETSHLYGGFLLLSFGFALGR